MTSAGDAVYWPEFCGDRTEYDAFWSWEISFNTDSPDVTRCFQNTALVWFICGALWAMTPFYVAYVMYWPSVHSWASCSAFNTLKTAAALLLTMTSLFDVMYMLVTWTNGNDTPDGLTAKILLFLSFALATFLTRWVFTRTFHTSGVLFVFWLLTLIADVIILRSKLMTFNDKGILFTTFCIQFGLVSFQFLASLFPDKAALALPSRTPIVRYRNEEETPLLNTRWKPPEHRTKTKPCPKETATFLSNIFFTWMTPKLFRALRTKIQQQDIWDIMDDMSTKECHGKFIECWQKQLEKRMEPPKKVGWSNDLQNGTITGNSSKKEDKDHEIVSSQISISALRTRRKNKKKNQTAAAAAAANPSLVRALWSYLGLYFMAGGSLMLINMTGALLSSQVLQLIITFIEDQDPYAWKGYFYASILLILAQLGTTAMENHYDICWMTGVRMRGALVSAICRKAMRLSSAGRRTLSVGGLVSMISVDILTIHRMFLQCHFAWLCPIYIGMAMFLLWQQIGWACLPGMLMLLGLLPASSAVVARKMKRLQKTQMELKDKRLKITNQILSGIKVLKLYAWEPYFEKQVQEIRRLELNVLRTITLLAAIVFTLWFSSSFLVAVVCFLTYSLSSPDHVLDAKKVFVSLSLINVMSFPLSITAQVVTSVVQAVVSFKRIQSFLLREEIEKKTSEAPLQYDSEGTRSIQITNGVFSWGEEEGACLQDININIKQGQLVAIVGVVGSGKSSLIQAILGEMLELQGSVQVKGSLAYVPQLAWIQNLTLRENILFGKPMNRQKYQEVLEVCALLPDLSIIPGGDMTEIGERGINLSGGQKQRVSLARAAYQDSDIYLLDDPLSAVDSHVGTHLFKKLLGPEGMLKNKTRVLVTHGIRYLPEVDNIIVLKDGRISEVGSYETLVKRSGEFAEFLQNYMKTNEESCSSSGYEEADKVEPLSQSPIEPRKVVAEEFSGSVSPKEDEFSLSGGSSFRGRSGTFHRRLRRRKSSRYTTRADSEMSTGQPAGALIEEEFTEAGRIKPAVLSTYIKSAGWVFPAILAASCVVYILVQCATQLWLSAWSRDAVVNGTTGRDLVGLRVGVYGGLAALQVFAVTGLSVALALGSMAACLTLHTKLLHSVFRSPMSFFDTTPVGRLVNRFSKDMNSVDVDIPFLTQRLLTMFFSLVAAVILVLYTLPISAVVILPLVAIFFVIQRIYVKSACQLQRIDAISRSPIYGFIGEALVGAPSIRAYRQEQRFMDRADELLDRSQSAWFEVQQASRWVGTCVEVIGNLALFATAVFGIMQKDNLDSSALGMAISFSMQITVSLLLTVRTSTEVEMQIVSVERIKEYTELPSEAPWEIPESKPPSEWPGRGSVTFKDYKTRYRAGLDLVLKGVSCHIEPGEKVGIVGRTGAGKSSLTLSLFRLIEATEGFIEIDGQNIGSLGLHDVRGRITIIPQDPVLFSGTLRFNVDPSGQHTDAEIWSALDLANLKVYVDTLSEKLEHDCGEEGESLSVGQRQLVCLARALLRKSKILVLDEATAAVDMETDDRIQSTVRSEFKDSTVITIAHRLNTILDYDRVIVMEDGYIKEYDSPNTLLTRPQSLFYLMAKDAGIT